MLSSLSWPADFTQGSLVLPPRPSSRQSMQTIGRLLSILTLITLAGCFKSTSPFIWPDTADYPWREGTQFARYERSANKAAPADQWEARGDVSRLSLSGGYYLLPSRGATKQMTPTLLTPTLLKRIGENEYIAQQDMIYALVVVQGNEIFEYQFSGYEQLCPQEFIVKNPTNEFNRVLRDISAPDCIVPSIDALASLFHLLKKLGIPPTAKYVLL